jgi:hypothetical protein
MTKDLSISCCDFCTVINSRAIVKYLPQLSDSAKILVISIRARVTAPASAAKGSHYLDPGKKCAPLQESLARMQIAHFLGTLDQELSTPDVSDLWKVNYHQGDYYLGAGSSRLMKS